MGLNTSRANTFAAVPGLPIYRLEHHDVLFRQVFVYDAASPDAMTGPVDVLVEDDRISAIGAAWPRHPEPGSSRATVGICWCPG